LRTNSWAVARRRGDFTVDPSAELCFTRGGDRSRPIMVLIHNTGNGFVGDLPNKGIKSFKVTRHASFPIAIVSPIELGWSTTPLDHSLGF